MLDVDIANIIYTVVNIVILYAIFRLFLFKRVDKILEARKAEIENATTEAENKAKAAEETKAEYEKNLSEIDVKTADAVREAREKGETEAKGIIEDAKKQAEKILEDAKKQSEVYSEQQKEALQKELSDIVLDATTKMNAETRSAESDKALYQRFIESAGKKPVTTE